MPNWFGRHPVTGGALAGLVWGILMRGWMRFVSPTPEFSWSGTGFILGASTIAGACLGLAWMRRRDGGRGWWRLWGVPMVLLGVGAGGVMLPSVLLGALALGRTNWNRVVRAVIGALAVAAQVVFFGPAGDPLPAGRAVPGLAAYAALITFEAWAASVVFRPGLAESRGSRRVPAIALLAVLGIVGVGVGTVALFMTGVGA